VADQSVFLKNSEQQGNIIEMIVFKNILVIKICKRMKQKFKYVFYMIFMPLLILSAISCEDLITDAVDDSNYVYYIQGVDGVTDSTATPSLLNTFVIKDDGDIELLQSLSAPSRTNSIVINPAGTKAYVVGFDARMIMSFDIKPDGKPFYSTVKTASPDFWEMCIDSSGKFGYVISYGNTTTVFSYSIDDYGKLTPINSVYSGSAANHMQGCAVHPNGKYFYYTAAGNFMRMHNIAANGGLVSSIEQSLPISSPFDIYIDSTGKYAYITTTGSPGYINAYEINSIDGKLSAAPISTDTHGDAYCFISIDRTGNFLFVSLQLSNAIASYKINKTDGTLTWISNTDTGTGSKPWSIASHPAKDFLYCQKIGAIGIYKINSDGTLSFLKDSPSMLNPITVGGRIVIHRNMKLTD
jgi:6-phosphogluconolactonase (cycloisomerase 2 family)